MPTQIIQHGSTAILLTGAPRFRRRRDGLDTCDLEFDSNTFEETILSPGSSLTPYGYAGMEVLECETEIDGTSYTHRISAAGVVGTKAERMLYARPKRTLEGFDSGSVAWITRNESKIVEGSRFPSYNNLVCVDADAEPLEIDGWYRVTGQYLGIINGAKPIKRTISNNAGVMQRDSLVNTLTGGWKTPEKSEFFWPHVTVTFHYVSLTTPQQTLPAQNATAPGQLFPVVEVPGEVTDATYHWPNGWRLVSFSNDVIPGTTITDTVETWEYQQKITL